MEIKTYDTILTSLCDYFDSAIAPRRITRANTNIIFLILKAFAKGLEVINNLVVLLRNKFDPERCSEEDLDSIAKLVGTSRLLGSATGLKITVTNTSKTPVLFEAGIYTYKQSDEAVFVFNHTIQEDIPAVRNNSVSLTAMSTEIKPIHVTAQSKIVVEGRREDGTEIVIPSTLTFSCGDNKGLQGSIPENDLDFRKRIVEGTSTATLLNKMETEINNLPYIYSCRVLFNNSTAPATITYPGGSVSVDPYNLLITIAGTPGDRVAEIISSYGVYETMQVPERAKYVDYKNDIFMDSFYRVYYIEPIPIEYSLKITYEVDPKTIAESVAQQRMEDALSKYKDTNEYMSLLTEREFSNYLSELGINTLQILDVDLLVGKEKTVADYLKVPKTNIARLKGIEFQSMTV